MTLRPFFNETTVDLLSMWRIYFGIPRILVDFLLWKIVGFSLQLCIPRRRRVDDPSESAANKLLVPGREKYH